MTFLSYFKKTLLVLLSLGLISTANAVEADEEYFIATSAHNKAFEQTSNLKRVTGDSRDAIEGIVNSKSQHVILMTKGSIDKPLDAILKMFNAFVSKMQKNPGEIFQKLLISGGIEGEEEEEKEEENAHNLLVAGTKIKKAFGDSIKNVYAPSLGDGYNIGPNQARISYKIDDLSQLLEFWHTEPASIEQFLVWKEEKKQISNVLIVSRKPMCQFCSRFLLHSFFTEEMKSHSVNFMVFSLSALENIAEADGLYLEQNRAEISHEFFELRGLLLTVAGGSSKKVVEESSKGKEKRRKAETTVFDRIKNDTIVQAKDKRNYLSIYGF